jgi:hypothetical protein
VYIDIYAYAVSALNEPGCAVSTLGANATATGPWQVTPSGESTSDYLTANLVGPGVNSSSAQVIFLPDIKQSGNYTVTLYTPGCSQDNSCPFRGIANVVGNFAAGQPALQTRIYQTNNFEKYDQIYHGYVDAGTAGFRPSITLTPLSDQNDSIRLVALRVRFQLLDASSSGLNGLFEFNPNLATVDTDFASSPVDTIGMSLDQGAQVTSIQVTGSTLWVSGNFNTSQFANIFSMSSGNASALPNTGLNAPVATSFVYGNTLFLGGNFTDTAKTGTAGLNHVAAFDTSKNTWATLGAGVNGPVHTIVPLLLNVTANQPETCITINGEFTQVLATGSSPAFSATGIAIWVPSRNAWLNNLDVPRMKVRGKLSAATNVTGASPFLAGTIMSQGFALSGAASLSTSSGQAALSSLGLKIQPSTTLKTNVTKRAVANSSNISGVATGLFNTDNNRNLTVLGGHFTATDSRGASINNLAFLNSDSAGNETITGLTTGVDSSSVFLALAAHGDTLYAGGEISGTVNGGTVGGVVFWDLAGQTYASTQPPALMGANGVSVNAITVRPTTTDVYVGGQFDAAGSFSCPGLCVFSNGQWTRPGTGIQGNVTSFLWQGNDKLLVGGDMDISGNKSYLANYDASKQAWSSLATSSMLPGPVTALTPANSDSSNFWIAGTATNGSAYLIYYDGSNLNSVGDVLGKQTTVRGLSILSLSSAHDDSSLVPANMALLVTGQLNVPNFGNASAALFNGTAFTPFVLSTSGNNLGSISQLVTERQQSFSSQGGHLALGFVVLIALAIALALTFLIVLAGLLLERRRRRKEGYRPAPQNYFEKTANMGRIPPEHLFGSLGRDPRAPNM